MCEEGHCLGTVISGLSSPFSHCPLFLTPLTPLPSRLPANKQCSSPRQQTLNNRFTSFSSGKKSKDSDPCCHSLGISSFSVSNHRLSNTFVLGVGWGGGLAVPKWLTKQFISLFAWLSLKLTKAPQVPSLSVLRCALTHFPRSHN